MWCCNILQLSVKQVFLNVGYMTNDTCLDRRPVLVKFSHYTCFCRSTALPSLCILPVSTHRRIIHQFSLCAQILPDCLLSPCCCVYRVPYLYCKMIIMIKYFSLRHCVNSGFSFVCVFTTATVKGELLSALGAVSSLHVTVNHDCPSASFRSAALSFFLVFVSPFQYQWG